MIRLPEALQPAEGLPQPAREVPAELAVFYASGSGPHWLVYEVARDFMSAPRGFAVVAIWPDDSDVLELNSAYEYDGIQYLEDGSMAERGCFLWSPSPWDAGPDTQHILLSLPGRRCEWLCRKMELAEVLYHQSSAAAALRHWLATH